MADSPMKSGIATWAVEYRNLLALPLFFDTYRHDILERRGDLPDQNFLIGTGLLREDEVSWCRVLRWLLDPASCQTFAVSFQKALLKRHAGLTDFEQLDADREVSTEEGYRLDIVLSDAKNYVVIEAKVNAAVQEHQKRYLDTERRDGRKPWGMMLALERASGLEKDWHALSWGDLAQLLGELCQEDEGMGDATESRWLLIAREFKDFIQHHYDQG